MHYHFKCKNCGKSTYTESTAEELPKKVSCMNCFHIHKVISEEIELFVENTLEIDEEYKKEVEKVTKRKT